MYAWVLDVRRCADLVSVCFGIGCGALCRFIFWGIRPDTLLAAESFETVFCILRCWLWDVVPICSLYASVLVMGRCADLVPVCFGIGCGTLCRSGSCMLRCWLWNTVPICSLYASVLVVGRCADLVPVCFGIGCGTLCRFFLIYCVFFGTGQDVHSLLFSALCG